MKRITIAALSLLLALVPVSMAQASTVVFEWRGITDINPTIPGTAVGDTVIIISYAMVEDPQARAWVPKIVHVDRENRIRESTLV